MTEVTHEWVGRVPHAWVGRVPHAWVPLVHYVWVLLWAMNERTQPSMLRVLKAPVEG